MRRGESDSISKRSISTVERKTFIFETRTKSAIPTQRTKDARICVKNQVHDPSYNIENLDYDVYRRNCRDINKSNETSFREHILENDNLDDISETNIEVPE